MKKILYVLLGFLFMSFVQAQPSPATDSGVVISKEHPSFTLTLSANPTTGYSWFIFSYDKARLQLISHRFVAPDSKLVGASGKEIWEFKASALSLKAPCFTIVKLIYARPWDLQSGKYSAAQIKTYNVVIH